MKKLISQLCLISGILVYQFTTADLSQAQITSDGSVGTNIGILNQLDFNISGGTQKGGNLFHSFREFSVPMGGAAIFLNAAEIQNIFSRVTGGSISNINGLITANGSANLFLLNPNGIIFGPNAQLDIRGSFIATTANQINFHDGTSFSATEIQAQPLLSSSIPVSLQFREKIGQIVNQSRVQDSSEVTVGLQVQPGKTIALVGGDVLLDGGYLNAPAGRIEIGSVAENSLVSLSPIAQGWALDYQGVQNFRDIQLLQGSSIETSGEEVSGNIHLQGKKITVTNNSGIVAFNFGVDQGRSIVIKASESLEVSDLSSINSNVFSTGTSGDITIETSKLIVFDSFIDTSSQGDGTGGNLTVNASEEVLLYGQGGISRLTTQTFGKGNAGDLKVTTKRLTLRTRGQIDSSTRLSLGNGGTVSVNASEFIEVSGQRLTDEGKVVASSGIFSRGNSTGIAGNITINTPLLTLQDGAQITVSSPQGQAGNLKISADTLTLNKGSITAETGKSGVQSGANITLQLSNLLSLENESLISARANGDANGGNIAINSLFLLAFPPTGPNGSNIIAKAERGKGGKITIQAQGIFGIAEGIAITGDMSNKIDASSEFGASGQVQINSTLDPNRGVIRLPETVVDPNALVAQNPCLRGTRSQFVRTGRGGLPPSPREDLSSQATQARLVEPIKHSIETAVEESDSILIAQPIIPAQGWVFNEQGEVLLVAYDPTVTGSLGRLPSSPPSCSVP